MVTALTSSSRYVHTYSCLTTVCPSVADAMSTRLSPTLQGAPGIGKTTSILALARALLGENYKEGVLELNASDERYVHLPSCLAAPLPLTRTSRSPSGIDVVRNRIKTFAQKKVTLPMGRHKLVILDEADSMTTGAQQALRRTMEIYSNTTRFAFACNQSSKIIEPIQSRCAILRYARLSDQELLKRLLEICEIEKVSSRDGVEPCWCWS